MIRTRVHGIGEALVTTFGLGHLRPAPGTWGSMPPVVLVGLLLILGVGPHHGVWSWTAWLIYHGVLLVVLALFSCGCLAFGTEAEAIYGKKDPGTVCADETAGVTLPLMFLPGGALAGDHAPVTLLMAFLAFRATDILKLPPARGLQRHPGGVGILVDDLVAGVQAMVVVQMVARLALA